MSTLQKLLYRVIPLSFLVIIVLFLINSNDVNKKKETVIKQKNSAMIISNTIVPLEKNKTKINFNCSNLKNYSNKIDFIKDESIQFILSFSNEMKELNLSKKQQKMVVQKAGMPLDEFRSIVYKNERFSHPTLSPIQDRKIIDIEKQTKIDYYKALFSRNYTAIVLMVKQGKLTRHSVIGDKSVLAHTLLQDKGINPHIVEQLIDEGLSPHFVELVELTRANIPFKIIKIVADNITENINQSWYENNQYKNLTLLATTTLNYQLFSFWFNQGIPASINEFDFSAMDMLTTPKNTQERRDATKIFIALATQAIKPYDTNNLNQIKKWLPLDVQLEFKNYFQNNVQTSLSNIEAIKSQELIDHFTNKNNQLKPLKKLVSECNKKNKDIHINMDVNAVDALEKTSQKLTDDDKRQFEQLKKIMINYALTVATATTDSEWIKVLNAADLLVQESGSIELLSLALSNAIQKNAPFYIIKELINRGAVLPENIIFILAITGNLQLLKKLVPLGLNFHYKDEKNRNGLYYVILHNSPLEMLDYLLNNNVSITPEIDLLEVLLSKDYSIRTVNHFQKLVNYGHKITPIHLTIHKRLKMSNNQLYNALIPILH